VVEAVLHQRFASNRTRGEWFALDKNDLVTFDRIIIMLNGSGAPDNVSGIVDESEIEQAEEIQELVLDDPELRIEKRYRNGELLGFALRERNKERKVVRYIGKQSHKEEFDALLDKLTEPVKE
jgi:hypothetical protein